jgi:RecA/RadA recombinase
MATKNIEYTKEMEDAFLQVLYTDPELFVRVKNITSAKFFDDLDNREVMKFLLEYTDKHASLPQPEVLKGATGHSIEKIAHYDADTPKWFMEEYEIFCQHKAAKQAVLDSMELIEKHNLSEVVERVKKAAELGIVKDLGLSYFDDPKARLEEMRNRQAMVSTGWKSIDQKLYGGLERGTISIWAGQSGAGKSLFLQNQALNWAEMGMNVIYITLELSQHLTGMRMDAMVAGYGTKDIMKNIDDVHMKVKAAHKEHNGDLNIKQLPNGCNANDIRAYVKEYSIQTGRKVDAVLVDYLDLCSPLDKRVGPSDLFVKDKYVSEELRNLAIELDLIMVTASQLNRGSHDEIEFGHQHMAGGISKVNTADNVFGIFTTISMKEAGRYQVQFLKTRSSAGVGSKVDLGFDVTTLRIRDLTDDEADATSATASNILQDLKKKNVVTEKHDADDGGKVRDNDNPLKKAQALRDLVKRKNI